MHQGCVPRAAATSFRRHEAEPVPLPAWIEANGTGPAARRRQSRRFLAIFMMRRRALP